MPVQHTDALATGLVKTQIIISLWMAIFIGALTWSGINPKDSLTWALEVAPAIIGAFILAVTYNSFRLTPLLYFFILIHCLILMIGGHYTYAEVPFFNDLFAAERNNYDKLAHFFQGFIPALLTREILMRKQVVNSASWRNFIIISICKFFKKNRRICKKISRSE